MHIANQYIKIILFAIFFLKNNRKFAALKRTELVKKSKDIIIGKLEK